MEGETGIVAVRPDSPMAMDIEGVVCRTMAIAERGRRADRKGGFAGRMDDISLFARSRSRFDFRHGGQRPGSFQEFSA